MSLLRDEKNEVDTQSCHSSDCSSSFSSTSSRISSSSTASSVTDGSNEKLFSSFTVLEDPLFRLSSLVRHRKSKPDSFQRDYEEGRQRQGTNCGNEQTYYTNDSHSGLSDVSYSSKRRKHGRKKVKLPFHSLCNLLLLTSILVYFAVLIATTEYTQNRRTSQRRNRHSFPHRPPHSRKKDSVSKKEALQSGCELDPVWQTSDTNSHLLSCQLLHELDLSEALSVVNARGSGRRQRGLSSSAHLGSGLWRDVWKIEDFIPRNRNSTQVTMQNVALKTMKQEHEINHRNFDRHRREAATMSRLTKSSNIANLYAYCGNSILTEFAAHDLSRMLNLKSRRDTNSSANKRRRTKNINTISSENQISLQRRQHVKESRKNTSDPSLAIRKNTSEPLSSLTTTLPLATRIDWALQASRAVADMHQMDVIHADITTKQFLIISTTGDPLNGGNHSLEHDVQIKINDFNRCRFVPRRRKPQGNETNIERANTTSTKSAWGEASDKCTVQIPSAPGSYRSPEEYSGAELTAQMDVYSLGHVLYEIWTSGKSPWHDVGGKLIKNMVKNGVLPAELKKLNNLSTHGESRVAGNNSDVANGYLTLSKNEQAFGRIIRKCYVVDPKRRITADTLVQELSMLFDSVRNQNGTD